MTFWRFYREQLSRYQKIPTAAARSSAIKEPVADAPEQAALTMVANVLSQSWMRH